MMPHPLAGWLTALQSDGFTQAWTYMCMKSRSNAPFIPRIVLIGPPGSGKNVQADLLKTKYGIVHGATHCNT